MKRFRAALKNKSNWPSLVTLALILACSLFSFWDTRFSEQARSAAFALVAVEFFIMLVVHLEEVKAAVGEIGKPKGAQLTKWKRYEMNPIIDDAKEELFFCGVGLSRLYSYREKLLEISEKVPIRLLAADSRDEAVYNNRLAMYGREAGLMNLEYLACFAERSNIEIRTTKFVQPIIISARDPNASTGKIQVAFPDYGKTGGNYPCVYLYPADTWYKHYKKQIELLWEQGTPWQP